MTTPDDSSQIPSDATPAEQLQRKLVQDVKAYEVDPPAPDRAAHEDPGRE